MKIEAYNFGQLKIRKVIGYIYLILSGIGVGLMLEGVGHNTSFFERHNAPVWLYIITIIVCVILFILYLNSLSSTLRKVGDIEIHNHQLSIKIGKRSSVISNVKINRMKISPDYRFSHEKGVKRKRILQVTTDDFHSSYDIEISPSEEEELNKIIEQITSSGL